MGEVETKLKALLSGKFKGVATVKAYCEEALSGKYGAAVISRLSDVQPPQIGAVTDEYGAVAEAAQKEIEAMKSGKTAEAPTIQSSQSGGKTKKKKAKKGGAAKSGGGAKKAGAKPKVDY